MTYLLLFSSSFCAILIVLAIVTSCYHIRRIRYLSNLSSNTCVGFTPGVNPPDKVHILANTTCRSKSYLFKFINLNVNQQGT